jgi:transposase/integrase
LFYYFRLEDQVPENRPLRLIDKHISFEFVRQQLKDSCSETGRPSIDPELLLRILLVGYLYGISSERKLVEELRMHLAWRWFTGLGFDQEIPHHSTFSKNRHGRFQESKVFEQLFEQIVKQCVEVGLVRGKELSVDGSFVEANAAKQSRAPRGQLAEAAQVHHTVRQYLRELEQQNPVEEPIHQQDQISTTDPDSTYATKGGTPARLGYYDNYLVDNDSCVIVGVQATAARMSQETVDAQDMLTRFARWQGRAPDLVAADTTYGNGEFLQWLSDRNITPYMRTREASTERTARSTARAFHLQTETQSLYLSCRPAAELRGTSLSESRFQLHLEHAKSAARAPATMHQQRLFERAMFWELIRTERNPMGLVEIPGSSRRWKRPIILTVDQYFAILQLLTEPYRTTVVVAQCLGLRVSEILALQWPDINFTELTMRVTRAVVDGVVDEVKTEYSEDDLPLDPDLGSVLLTWKRKCPKSEDDWVFPSPVTGRCYHASPIQQDYIRPAGRKLKLGDIGWHTFRHTYRSWLDLVGTTIGVQQKLMRHAQIATTMNVYGNT